MRHKLLFVALMAFSGFGFAQEGKSLWDAKPDRSELLTFKNRAPLPDKHLYNLNIDGLKTLLANAPLRETANGASNVIVSFPNAEGAFERYMIFEAPVMEAELAARYPDIKSYYGKGIDDPTAVIRFSLSPLGLQTMKTAADKPAVFIEPFSIDYKTYSVYKRSDKQMPFTKFECEVIDDFHTKSGGGSFARPNADDGILRTYRLAMSVTGEYTAYHGGTKALALAAINTTMTRVNGVFEKDFAVRMVLIANTDAVIYTSSSSDPYGSTDANYNNQLQSTLNSVIGSANYDIGHLMSAIGNNGNAGCIGCVCASGKGSGFTTSTVPVGDAFDIDFVAHEMGHQFGANHTFTFSNEGTGVQMEPGSGTTIMGYAGITGATDVQPHSDPFFHAVSIQQITNYVKTTSCQTNTNTGNAIPTANAGSDYTIPKGTPFMLKGTATDANAGDVLTYCWEQMNSGTSSNTYPSATATSGAAFRSYVPSTSNTRYFPRMQTIKTGVTTWQWEAVPNVARTMNFRLTVRDNRAGGSGNNSDDMVVTVNGTAGPFTVSAPNTAVSWAVGSTQTVTWNVAGTTGNGVNAANVEILLSTDGGDTYPIVLLASTPNDGSQTITVPNNPGTQNRIMVKGANHIFFDISNTNFTITSGGGGDTTAPGTPLNLTASGTTQTTTNLSWSASTDNVGVTGYDVYQNGAFKANVAGTTYTVTGLTPSTAYSFYVRAKDAAGNASGNSNTVNVTTLASGGASYCASQGNNTSDEYISKVQVGTINYSSGAAGYSDFTSQSANLNKGSAYTITVTPAWTGSTYAEGYAVWIDYNGDKDFADAGELVWSKAASTTTPATGSFTVPATATTGVTRMRVSMKYNGIPTACEAFSYGEVEDYTVNIQTGGTTPPPAYCASKGNSVADEYIKNVQFSNLNYPSGANAGYADFTAQSASVSKGGTYNISVTPHWTGSTYPEGYAVWIDYNADGDFADSGELAWSKTASTTTPATGSITIPSTAITGSTRMRVSMKYNGVPTACETFSYGEVEDYTVVIGGSGKDAATFAGDITLYPNPTESVLNLTNVSDKAAYRIYTITGQDAGSGVIVNGLVDVSRLTTGNYILEINDNGMLTTKRFIKK
jgi:hypothetical protein